MNQEGAETGITIIMPKGETRFLTTLKQLIEMRFYFNEIPIAVLACNKIHQMISEQEIIEREIEQIGD